MTAPSEPVRPADQETVQALRRVLADPGQIVERHVLLEDKPNAYTQYESLTSWQTRAVVASELWQRLVRERDEASNRASEAIRLGLAAERERDEARAAVARVEAAHPLTETRRCGARVATPVAPIPGPANPPRWCFLPDDGHARHRTHDGVWLDQFSLPIEQRPAVVTYRCDTCCQSGRTPEQACHVRAALRGDAEEASDGR